ncbi:diaminobutyrate acetyltransferase [Methylophaga sp. OBS1]|uniref:diaminobutyrate acetyltransferase n=1 Tax=Methylophaga sp. OBS1 TaxID=2991933 RepID=UPI002253F2F2|nr:diaminobutyrate acetyltransferase [Methylophaga sp. OBS1]MCX4190875.1 diaminobutyrate acetyltransferase [Methylophaga sp. OBS1]MCX4192178.1 diaminobutyrate acetyltransferase [Methylophaga sp. OBS1]
MNLAHTDAAPITLRAPAAEDGAAVYELIAQCPPLDTNSMYCNLLQCTHFSATSVAAEKEGDIVGFISGYIEPDNPDTLFIWQVAVGEKARGQGLAGRMLRDILSRQQEGQIKFIETTITPDNRASWALFESLANKLGTELNHSVMFDRQQHFAGQHETEMLVRLGPLQ